MIYGKDEHRPVLQYEGTDPRVRGGQESFTRLLACLERGGQATSLANRTQAERDCLLQCGAAGWRLDAEALGEALGQHLVHLGRGNEHDVYFDQASQRVIKVTQSTTGYGAQGDALAYLTSLSRCNRLFADTIRFEGLVRVAPLFDALAISQPFVQGTAASAADIEEYFADLGFVPDGQHAFAWSDPAGRAYLVADARPDNVIREGSTGLICPIDLQILVRDVAAPI